MIDHDTTVAGPPTMAAPLLAALLLVVTLLAGAMAAALASVGESGERQATPERARRIVRVTIAPDTGAVVPLGAPVSDAPPA